MTFAFKKPEDSPGFLLWQLTNQWQRQQRNALAKLHLTHAQFVVLAAVLWLSDNTQEVIMQKHVAEMTHIDKMSMSDLVAILINKKMLKRLPHKEDKRAHSLTLTEKGRCLALKAVPIVESIDAVFFSKNTKNLVQLMKILKNLS